MQVKDWMSTPVVSVAADCPGLLAYQLMLEHQIRRLPVLDEDGALVGMVTDRDLRAIALARLGKNSSEELKQASEDLIVRDVMATDVTTVGPETDIREAALIMHNQKFSGLPAVDSGKVVGVITVQDLMEILVAALDSAEDAAQI